MTALYSGRTVYYFPIGIEAADYAVVVAESVRPFSYRGAVSYLDQENIRKLNSCLMKGCAVPASIWSIPC